MVVAVAVKTRFFVHKLDILTLVLAVPFLGKQRLPIFNDLSQVLIDPEITI